MRHNYVPHLGNQKEKHFKSEIVDFMSNQMKEQREICVFLYWIAHFSYPSGK